jgi:hypothetical protein
MTRPNIVLSALGAIALLALPLASASAQSGDALANAENTCIENGIKPHTPAFETCVSSSAQDYDEGLPGMAVQQAEAVRDADDVCGSYGITPWTLGYRQCVNMEARSRGPRTANLTEEQPHATASVDGYGFRHDRDGNVLDRNGYMIRAVP